MSLTAVLAGGYAWLEVEDQGGPRVVKESGDEHGRGLELVAALAREGDWTIDTGTTPGSHVVWAQLDWPGERCLSQGNHARGGERDEV